MVRHPPSSTRSDPLLPYTRLFRPCRFHRNGSTARASRRRDTGAAIMVRMGTVWDRTTAFLGDRSAAVLAIAGPLIFLPTCLQEILRSEAPTSELQSLMRISYAVL